MAMLETRDSRAHTKKTLFSLTGFEFVQENMMISTDAHLVWRGDEGALILNFAGMVHVYQMKRKLY